MTKPDILAFETLEDWDIGPMNDLFTVHQFPASGNAMELSQSDREKIVAFAFKGHSTLGPDIIDAFPNIGLIANYGVGYDTIDVAHATSKGIRVTNTPDVLTNDVADLAVGMLLALNRGIIGADDWVRSGNWSQGAYPLQRTLSGVNIGIAGLGRIGRAVADRLIAFNTKLHYYSRAPKDVPAQWTYHDSIVGLAKAVDILMVTVSGGPDTSKIISKAVIDAVGPDGLIVNASRGSTVDEAAMLDALQSRSIRGVATDVFNNEPHLDPRWTKLDNVVLQPHQSSGTIETRKAMGQLQRDNIVAFLDNRPLVTPVN